MTSSFEERMNCHNPKKVERVSVMGNSMLNGKGDVMITMWYVVSARLYLRPIIWRGAELVSYILRDFR